MKILITFIMLSVLITPVVHAAARTTPTPTIATTNATPEATAAAEEDTIQKIKEMVASKVSKLNLIEKRGTLGVVKAVSNTQITIETPEKTQRFIDIDELTQFQDSLGSSKSFGISDVEPNMQLAFIGNYNKDTRRLLARFITKTASIPLNLDGVVSDKDVKEYLLTITLADGTKRILDYQTSSRAFMYDKEDGETKSGFTKIEVGQRVIVVGFQDPDNEDTLTVTRITHFTEIPPSPAMKKHAKLPEETEVESLTPTPSLRPSNTR